MTILVFGSSGFIGERVVHWLVERGERVAAVDLTPPPPSFAELGDAVGVHRGDVTQLADVLAATVQSQPTRILDLAFSIGAGNSNPYGSMKLNVLGTDNCFEAARLCGVDRVVYASSIAIHGKQLQHGHDVAITEESPTFAAGQYSAHKIFNEFQAGQYNQLYGMSNIAVRPGNVMGPDKARGLVDQSQLVALAAAAQPVRLPNESIRRVAVHVDDVAEVFGRVLLAGDLQHTEYHTGGTSLGNGELADMVRELIPDADISFDDPGGLDQSGCYLVDNSRIRDELGIEFPLVRDRVAQMINTVRTELGLPLV